MNMKDKYSTFFTYKGGITPLHAGIMDAGYHGNILLGKKQKNCRSLSLSYVTIVTCMQNARMQSCNSSFRSRKLRKYMGFDT